MADFITVCKKLKQAVPLESVPHYTIDPDGLCTDEELKKKLQKVENVYKEKINREIQFNLLGVCEIGDFSGNELLLVLLDICNNSDYNQSRNYIYFNIEQQTKAFIVFVKTSVLTDFFANDDFIRHMFAKLFNDSLVENHYQPGEADYQDWAPSCIEDYRKEAKLKFPKFLGNQITKELILFGNAFFSLLAKCAYRMSQLDGLRKRNPAHGYPVDNSLMDKFENIPYPACIKFAFDAGRTGKIFQLFGEGDYTDEDDRRQGAVKVAEELIKSAFQNGHENNESAFTVVKNKRRHRSGQDEKFDEEATERIAEDVKRFYDVTRSSNVD